MLPLQVRVDLGVMAIKMILCIPQSSRFTEGSPWDCLLSYQEHSLGESYSSIESQLVYSTAPADWVTDTRCGEGSYPSSEMQWVYSTAPAKWATDTRWGRRHPQQRCSRCILLPQPIGPQTFLGGDVTFSRDAVGIFHSTPTQADWANIVVDVSW